MTPADRAKIEAEAWKITGEKCEYGRSAFTCRDPRCGPCTLVMQMVRWVERHVAEERKWTRVALSAVLDPVERERLLAAIDAREKATDEAGDDEARPPR